MSFSSILYTIILYPLIQIIEIAFKVFDKLFDNTGIAVIGVSFTVTLLCLPLYIVAEHWQQVERDTQTKLKPGIDRIKAVFKGDEQYMILSTFYRQNHYHPMMALRSSFGLLIQIPFFMAAYSCLSKLPALQGQSFLFIKDMGQQDAIFYIGKLPVNILPIAMTVINIIAGAIYTKGFPFKEKLQIYGMALLFLVILYSSPAGLVLYWTMNNVFSLVKNIFYKLKHPVWTLFWLMVAGIILVSGYVLFVYDGGASMKKRLMACFAMWLCIPIPLYLKAFDWLLDHPFKELKENKKVRNSLFIGSALGLTIVLGLVIPSSLISSSVQEFSNIDSYTNPKAFLNHSFWQAFGIFVAWASCIYFLFREKVQTLISVFFSIMFVCGIVNCYAFAGNYGSMDATLIFLDGFSNPSKLFMLLNLIISVVLIAALFLIFRFNKSKTLSSIFYVATFGMFVLSILNISKISKEYKAYEKIVEAKEQDTSLNTKFHLSKNNPNVIVLMMDRAQNAYFNYVLEDNPELKKSFSGFTFYPNTIAYNGHTLMASPSLYGGYEYTPFKMNQKSDILLKDKHNEALLVLPRIFNEQAGFSATCSDLSWGNYSYESDMSFVKEYPEITGLSLAGRYSSDLKKTLSFSGESTSLSKGLERNLIWFSFFRTSPAILRQVVYYSGSWWASEVSTDTDAFLKFYSTLHYLPQITDFTSETGTYSTITNDATHANVNVTDFFALDKSSTRFPEEQAYYNFTICMEAVAAYLDYLKENGCYDNTRIIIVADHGIGYGPASDDGYVTTSVGGSAKDHYHPLLLFKDFGSSGEPVTDNTFMTNADTPTLALTGILEKPVNPFTGKLIFTNEKEDGVYITIDDVFMPHHSKSDKIFTVDENKWYKVSNNIFDDTCWIQEAPKN